MAAVVEQPINTRHKAYEQQWTKLRDGDRDQIDRVNRIAHLVEMAAPHRRERESRVIILHAHLLKSNVRLDNAPGEATENRRPTIHEHRPNDLPWVSDARAVRARARYEEAAIG
jgi:hypothetical protein